MIPNDMALRGLYLSITTAFAGGAAVLTLLPLSTSPAVAPSAPIAATAAVTITPQSVHAPRRLPAASHPETAAATTTTTTSFLKEQVAAGLQCATSARGVPLCAHGEDTHESTDHGRNVVAGSASSSTPTGDSRDLGCYGDGTSGPRVRAVYARPQGAPDRYASSLRSIRGWAAGISRQFNESAKATGGRRHVRFATSAGSTCTVQVLNVVLPDTAFKTFKATIDALEERGLNAQSSKYLVWADASGVCGMATTYADDRAGLDNLNNSAAPSYARVDRRCWGKVEAHELVHMLGGIQRSAPNATAGHHCSDGSDVMCYDDGSAGSTQRSVCPPSRVLLDCRNDDYFSTAPKKGSYLQTHWNTARSSFLASTLREPAPSSGASTPPATSPKPEATKAPPSPSPSPSPSGGAVPGLPPELVVPVPSVIPTLLPLSSVGVES